MNSEIPDWSFEFDPASIKKNIGQDHDLVELLWQNGQVVLHSQTNRKPSPNWSDARQPHRPAVARAGVSSGNAFNQIPDDELVSWIHYPVVDSFEKEFCSQFLGELPSMDIDKPIKQGEPEKAVNFNPFSGSSQQHNMKNAAVPDVSGGLMPPPRFQFPDPIQPVYENSPGGSGEIVNFSQFAPSFKGETRPPSFQIGRQGSGILSQVDVVECSAMTVGSSRCGSNQIPDDFPDQSLASSYGVGTAGGVSTGLVKEDDCNRLSLSQTEGRRTETLEPTLTSSSGGSDSSFGAIAKKCVDASIGHKRKGREGEETEYQSEALEIEPASGKKSMTQSGGSTRRSRAAEVHNMSERRRRDRINKKMKALQDLIPHCNKADKASMLDEAIEYLKSLQLQLQVMWMGGGMAPMMFPGAQHYMSSSMGVTMCPPTMPAVQPNMHMPRIPMVDQSFPVPQSMSQGMFGQTPVMNPMNFQNQMANPSFPEQFARYMAMHNIQTPQTADMFKFGRQGAQQNQTNSQPGGSSAPYRGGATDGASKCKIG